MVPNHPLSEGADIFILAFVESLLARLDVEHTGSIRDMGDLRVGWL
jgi:hypothetical protein